VTIRKDRLRASSISSRARVWISRLNITLHSRRSLATADLNTALCKRTRRFGR
jgi:hypothetical protein